jgi:outer membrane protein
MDRLILGERLMRFVKCCTVILLVLLATHAAAQSLKIGYVNGVRLERESAMTKQAIEEIKKEFASREQQLQELQKQGSDLQGELEKEGLKMKPADKQAKEKRLAALAQQFEQMQRSFAEDVDARQREAQARVLTEVNAIIKDIAEAGKFDLVVQQAVYNSAQMDITDQVLKEMAKRTAGSRTQGK